MPFTFSVVSRAVLSSLLAVAAVSPAFAATHNIVSATVADRYLVVYRGGQVPADAANRLGRSGARMVSRHDRFGMVSVVATAAERKQLATDTAVEYVIQDRVVTGTALLRRTAQADLDNGTSARLQSPLKVVQVPVGTPVATTPVSSTPTTSTPTPSTPSSPVISTPVTSSPVTSTTATPSTADTFYSNTPQGWAVKAAGGFGYGVAGGTTHGAWDHTLGAGVRIAVLDSGVDRTHPDIAPNLALNLSEVDQTVQPSVCDDGTPQDQSGHGTWVASLAAGALGTGTGRVVGMAPSATILNIKVLQRVPGTGTTPAAQCASGEASGLVSWLLKGVDDAVAQHADVIVMSLGSIVDLYSGDGAGLKVTFDRVTHAAAQAGVVLVAAAGNDGFDLSNPRYLSLPAQARDVVAVTASTNPDCAENNKTGAVCAAGPVTRPYYSNYGAPLNAIAAPGGNLPLGPEEGVSGWVRGACSSGKPGTADGLPAAGASEGCFNLGHQAYVQGMGTSAATPLVAGVAALVKAAHPGWDATTIAAALRSSAKQIPTLGNGLVDANAAIGYTP